jgi:hypothetical protein
VAVRGERSSEIPQDSGLSFRRKIAVGPLAVHFELTVDILVTFALSGDRNTATGIKHHHSAVLCGIFLCTRCAREGCVIDWRAYVAGEHDTPPHDLFASLFEKISEKELVMKE